MKVIPETRRMHQVWYLRFFRRWDDDDVRFVIDQDAELDFVNASSLKQQSECRHVAPFWHIILILSQTVFVVSPESRVWLAENQEIPILFIFVWPDRGSNPQFTKLYAITLITTPPMRLCCGYAN
jgi:hypothetical protein